MAAILDICITNQFSSIIRVPVIVSPWILSDSIIAGTFYVHYYVTTIFITII